MGKIDENKRKKKEALFNTAYELFTTKGITSTTISDIVEKAEVAKGTFYLYFTNKYDIKINWSFIKRRSSLTLPEPHLKRSRFTDWKIR